MTRSVRIALAAAVVGRRRPSPPRRCPPRPGARRAAASSAWPSSRDPVGFDTLGQKKAPVYTQLALAYTHNRLLKYDPAGEVVNDLAERWTQPNPTTYVVTLRKGVRFHNKPPVNGRELTSEDVKFTFDRLPSRPRPGCSRRSRR